MIPVNPYLIEVYSALSSRQTKHWIIFIRKTWRVISKLVRRWSPPHHTPGRILKNTTHTKKEASPVAKWPSLHTRLQQPQLLPVRILAAGRAMAPLPGHAEAASHRAQPGRPTSTIHSYALGSFGEKKKKNKGANRKNKKQIFLTLNLVLF